MKFPYELVLLLCATTACTPRQSSVQEAAADTTVTTLTLAQGDSALGEMQTRTYVGILPSAAGTENGTRYTLTVHSREYSGDGTCSLVLSNPATGAQSTYTGKRITPAKKRTLLTAKTFAPQRTTPPLRACGDFGFGKS